MSVVFNGTNTQLSRTTALPPIALSTVILWYYVGTAPTSGQFHVAWAHGTPSSNYFAFGPAHNGTNARHGLYSGVTTTYSTLTAVVSTWYVYALTINGTGTNGMNLYVGSVPTLLTATPRCTTTASIGVSSNTMYLGNSAAGTHWANGRIGNVKIFNAVLTLQEMLVESQQYRPLVTEKLVSWHPLMDIDSLDWPSVAWTSAGSLATGPGVQIPWTRGTHGTGRGTGGAVSPPTGTLLPHMMHQHGG